MTDNEFLDALEARNRSAVALYSHEEMLRLRDLSGGMVMPGAQFDHMQISWGGVRPMIERARELLAARSAASRT